jgi:hypothetical protein
MGSGVLDWNREWKEKFYRYRVWLNVHVACDYSCRNHLRVLDYKNHGVNFGDPNPNYYFFVPH